MSNLNAATSPVNFFAPQKEYPLHTSAKREQLKLGKGDCLFIPSFYFYHLQAYNLDSSA